MGRIKLWLGITFAFMIGLGVFGGFFYYTGGAGLTKVVFNYLISDLPDKKYGWEDFRDRGEGQNISGFYAFGDEESLAIWTLSGLKRYYHKPGTSVYTYRDTCGVVKQMAEQKVERLDNPEEIYFQLEQWGSLLRKENFVTVLPLPKENGQRAVDKAWAVSGRYSKLGVIEEGVCD